MNSIRPTTLRLLSATVSALLLSPGTSSAETKSAGERPNMVLIISDDQTYTDFGFMGNADVQTPHLDRLAQQSARYVNGYVPSSVCRPSLATLLTGLYPHQHGVHFNHPPPGFARTSQVVGQLSLSAVRAALTCEVRACPGREVMRLNRILLRRIE